MSSSQRRFVVAAALFLFATPLVSGPDDLRVAEELILGATLGSIGVGVVVAYLWNWILEGDEDLDERRSQRLR